MDKYRVLLDYMPIVRDKILELNVDIDPLIIGALIMQESLGATCAMKYEPDFFRRYLAPESIRLEHKEHAENICSVIGCSYDTEIRGRAFSWGVLQVMGQVAREHGFEGWFSELCLAETGIHYGVIHYKKMHQRYGGDTEAAVSAYNAGSARKANGEAFFVNQKDYVDPVMRYYRELKEL